jgi:cathepsin F
LDPTAEHGITPFSDLTEEEFEAQFLGLRPGGENMREFTNQMPTASPEEVQRLPKSFDWREKGAVTEVKMQVWCFCLLHFEKNNAEL